MQVLITGATAGIGRATAELLAASGATVIVHGRAGSRVRRTVRAIRGITGSQEVHGIVADFSDQDAVERLAQETATHFPMLDRIIHNAAIVPLTRELTPQGFERQLFVNHLAPFLLTHRLCPLLQKNAPARIVVVASQLERNGRIEFDDLQSARRYDASEVYAATKLANVLFTHALARRLEGSGVTVNALHPGIAGSSILNALYGNPQWMAPWTRYRQPKPDAAARSVVRLALDRDVATASGLYFQESEVREPSDQARDADLAERLWNVSSELLGISPELPISTHDPHGRSRKT